MFTLCFGRFTYLLRGLSPQENSTDRATFGRFTTAKGPAVLIALKDRWSPETVFSMRKRICCPSAEWNPCPIDRMRRYNERASVNPTKYSTDFI
jgi:hypothetical protein